MLDELAEIAHGHHLTDLERRCRTAGRQARHGEYCVAVLGEFKAGKSSLLNSLLGAELLPVQAIPATAVVTRVRFGDHLLARVKQPGRAPVEVPLGELREWVTQTGNPDNRRGVEWVEVQSPALADLAGLALVDTPGTGSSWTENTRTSLAWLPQAGAALVAISATQPLGEPDLHLIELLRPHTPNLTVVLTRIDLLTAPDAPEVLAHVRARLAARFADPPVVRPFSIRDGHEASRDQLRQQLRELAGGCAEAAELLVRHRVARIADELLSQLELARAAASSHVEAVTDLRSVLQQERTRLATVRVQAHAQLRPVLQRLDNRTEKLFGRELAGLVHQVGVAADQAMPTWHGTLAGETRAFRAWLEAELVASLTPLVDRAAVALTPLLDEGLEPIQQVGEAYVQRLQERVRAALGVAVRLPVPTPVPTGFRAPGVHLNAVFDSHLELLSWAVPMVLVRPLVHRHFRRTIGWQVEKNLYRAGYTTAGRAAASLRDSLDAYLEVLAGQVDAYLNLASEPSDLPRLDQELALLRQLVWPTRNPEVSPCPLR